VQQSLKRKPRKPSKLDRDEILRYSRHLIMPEVALEGQKKAQGRKGAVHRRRGLGSPLAMYLVRRALDAWDVDFDVVDFTNLQRQIIHSTSNVGRLKLDSAKERIAEINPYVQVDTYKPRFHLRMRWSCSPITTSSSTARTTFRLVIWSTTRAC